MGVAPSLSCVSPGNLRFADKDLKKTKENIQRHVEVLQVDTRLDDPLGLNGSWICGCDVISLASAFLIRLKRECPH